MILSETIKIAVISGRNPIDAIQDALSTDYYRFSYYIATELACEFSAAVRSKNGMVFVQCPKCGDVNRAGDATDQVVLCSRCDHLLKIDQVVDKLEYVVGEDIYQIW